MIVPSSPFALDLQCRRPLNGALDGTTTGSDSNVLPATTEESVPMGESRRTQTSSLTKEQMNALFTAEAERKGYRDGKGLPPRTLSHAHISTVKRALQSNRDVKKQGFIP